MDIRGVCYFNSCSVFNNIFLLDSLGRSSPAAGPLGKGKVRARTGGRVWGWVGIRVGVWVRWKELSFFSELCQFQVVADQLAKLD